MQYYGVDEVSLTFARNGCMIQFWGRLDPEEMPEKFTMVFPDIRSAIEVVESLRYENEK